MESTVTRFSWSFIALCCLLFTHAAISAAPLTLAPNFESLPVREFEVLEDPRGILGIDEVLLLSEQGNFASHSGEPFNRGVSQSVFWFRFQIQNPQSKPVELVLNSQNDYRTYQIYSVHNASPTLLISQSFDELLKSGTSHWELFNVTITQPAETTTEYFLRMEGNLITKLDLSVWEPFAYRSLYTTQQQLLGIGWGITLGIICLSLMVYALIREQVYLYYAFFLLAFLCFRVTPRGAVQGLLAWFPNLETLNFVATYSIPLIVWGAIRFGWSFLNCEQLPKIHQNVLKNSSLLLLGGTPLTLFLDAASAFQFFNILAALFTPIAIWVGIASWRRGNQYAMYYVAGWIGLLLPTSLLIFENIGLLQWNQSPYFLLEIGCLLEIAFYTLGLTVRIRNNLQERDQAQQAALAHLRENDRIKDDLLAMTTHELRTPLQGMLGLLESLVSNPSERTLSPNAQKIQLIFHSAKRLNTMISSLLDLTAARMQKMELQRECVALSPLVQSVVNLVRVQFQSSSTVIHNEVSDELPPISIDPNRFEQVLINLLTNACKYVRTGEVRIQAREQEMELIVEVHDSGKGVPVAEREKIFQSFYRANSDEAEGMGLGLALCREVIQAHGGTIGVTDSPLGGACFWVRLPRTEFPVMQGAVSRPSGAVDQGEAWLPTAPANIKKSGQRILVVDDDLTILNVVHSALEATQWSLVFCSSGPEALRYLETKTDVDLVLLDVMMPEMDGFEVCEVIREKHSPEELPIVFLTAISRAEDITQAFDAGANDYLTKPVLKAELHNRLAAHLELLRLRRLGQDEPTEPALERNQLLVNTMQQALECWEKQTGKGRIELVEESRLWGGYIDAKGTYRTRSLNQYFSIATLPKNPRWRKVVQTVEFVLPHLSESQPEYQRLQEAILQITLAFRSN